MCECFACGLESKTETKKNDPLKTFPPHRERHMKNASRMRDEND